MKSFSMDGLSMVLDSVKILYIQMNSFDLNKIIGLLQCFPCLEKLYIKVIILVHYMRASNVREMNRTG